MKRVLIFSALLAAMMPATAVMADPPHGHKEKHKEHHAERGRDRDDRGDDRRRDYRDHDRDNDRDRDREALLRHFGYDDRDNRGQGWGVGGVPPGHLKKIAPGMRLSPDEYAIIRDLDRWRLPSPDRDSMYVRRDDQIYRMNRDTQTVIEALGIVSNLLR